MSVKYYVTITCDNCQKVEEEDKATDWLKIESASHKFPSKRHEFCSFPCASAFYNKKATP